MSTLHASLRSILLEDPSAIERLPRARATRIDRLLEANAFEPLLYHRIRQHGCEGEIDRERFDRWRTAHLLALARAAAYGSALRKVSDAAAARSIPLRLLGGACMAFQVYPRPELRPLQELDVLAPPDRIEELRAALKSLRFMEVENLDPFARGRSQRRPLELDGVIIRLRSASLDPAAPWDDFPPGVPDPAGPARLPPAALAVHLAGRMGERRFAHSLFLLHDLMTVVRELRPAWKDVLGLARDAGLSLEACLAFHLLREVFTLELDEGFFRELERLLAPSRGTIAFLGKVALSALLQYPAPPRLVAFLGRGIEDARGEAVGAGGPGKRGRELG